MNTEGHIRQMFGDLMLRVAILLAEVDALRAELERTRAASPPDRAEVR